MEYHNFPAESLTDGICGPESGPNWHAWRTLKTDKMDGLNKKGKFQGYSGMVYCGKKMVKKLELHDGVWGPDNGPPCSDCLKEILVEGEEVDHEYRLKEIEAEYEKIKLKSRKDDRKKTKTWEIF